MFPLNGSVLCIVEQFGNQDLPLGIIVYSY